jgi:gamma-glutamyl-gamma-aminobutyrate hydrolase PuuD
LKKVYTVGPRDESIDAMFAGSGMYRPCSVPTEADIICFQGGPDIHPRLYGEVCLPESRPSVSMDEEDEYYFTKYADKPKVGICRGGQFLNVMSGGEMWQDVNNHNRAHELVNLLDIPDSDFSSGKVLMVTSVHHQMMIPHKEYGEVLGISDEATRFKSADKNRKQPDHDVEVVWYEHTKSLCFQPHPEYSTHIETRNYFFSLLKYLIG